MRASFVKRLGCALALTSLLVRLAISLVYLPAMVAQDAAAMALGEGQFKIVYCSLLGTMAVPGSDTFDQDNPDNTPPAPDSGACPLCQAIGATAFAVSPATQDLVHALVSLDTQFVDTGRVSPPSRLLPATARGPPNSHA